MYGDYDIKTRTNTSQYLLIPPCTRAVEDEDGIE